MDCRRAARGHWLVAHPTPVALYARIGPGVNLQNACAGNTRPTGCSRGATSWAAAWNSETTASRKRPTITRAPSTTTTSRTPRAQALRDHARPARGFARSLDVFLPFPFFPSPSPFRQRKGCVRPSRSGHRLWRNNHSAPHGGHPFPAQDRTGTARRLRGRLRESCVAGYPLRQAAHRRPAMAGASATGGVVGNPGSAGPGLLLPSVREPVRRCTGR